jgi:hypothetical protein
LIGSRQQHGLKPKTLNHQSALPSISLDSFKRSSNLYKKPSPLGVTAFFPRFISVRRVVSGAPMNGSLTRSWCGRVSLISSICKSLSREGV